MRHDANYYLILAGDHLYRMDYGRLLDAHVDEDADITVAALPVTPHDAPGMGIFLFDREGRIVGFEEKPTAERLTQIESSTPASGLFHNQHFHTQKPFIASMGIYVFSRSVLLELLQKTDATDFGREIIPRALSTHRVRAYLHGEYWADVGTIESFYDANIMLTQPQAPFKFYDPRKPIYTHERFLPPSHMRSCTVRESIVSEGCFLEECSIEHSVIGIRTRVSRGTLITRSVLLGADMYEAEASTPLGIGRDAVLDRVIMDKNASIGDGARLVNEAGVQQADEDGYFIRNGIIIVPKGVHIPPGTHI
jgi:glucose-1-phosphate adenylyltransferase